VRRLALLAAAAALWLFLAALPALADGGPHVSTVNNGSLGINADSCAGCHRAHTAQGPYLINAADEEALCLTCHGASGTGATTDVMTGIQYTLGTGGTVRGTTQLGALRGGGFDQARLGDPGRLATSLGGGLRTKVTVGAPENVTSAHLDLDGTGGVVATNTAWGNGANGSGAGPEVELSCATCHNPHGNGQYRILNPIPNPTALTGSVFVSKTPVTIVSSNATADLITTATAHGLSVGDLVTIAGHSVAALNGNWTVAETPTGTTMKLSSTATLTNPVSVFDIATGGTGGTAVWTSHPVADSPVDNDTDPTNALPTKNYTVIQTLGTQGTDSTYLLYASQVDGTYTADQGDYFHRTVPWNAPAGVTAQDDAPNGQPATNPSTAVGDVAFNIQITAWCSSCHTRYYANQNPNPTGTDPGPSSAASRSISATDAATRRITTGTTSHGFVVGDVVTITGNANIGANGPYTVETVPTATTFTLTGVNPTTGGASGTAIRSSAPQAAQSWWFERPGDSTYKYQHRTVPNRACTTCHVTHGSNAQMTGPYSSTYTRPDGTASASSRLLKIDNRGTCQACHDPTGTIPAGTYVGPLPIPGIP
jgi:predicted CXXCH cytochrome family protein